ncbi:MAG: hypothetical protein JO165_07030 [Candidatus Eremiobacteraeota bacterium]|nr:hypothetical protein [Candidatus Eremiobacteraeota bacterium]
MKKRALLSLAVLCVVTGCSFKSPAENIDFKPPTGWNSTPSIMGFQMWVSPKKDEMLMLMNRTGKLSQTFDLKTIPGNTYSEVTMSKEIRICSNQPARLVVASGKSKEGKAETTQMVLTTYANDNNYMAMYARPTSSAPDPQAEAAIRMLCLKNQ